MNKNTIISIIIVLVALVAIIFLVQKADQKPGKYDEFASCLAEEEVTFWGAFWCHNCSTQKSIFGKKSTEKLTYIECSTPDGEAQTEQCIEAGIQAYPTWEFADGERIEGVMQLEALAAKTSCELPS